MAEPPAIRGDPSRGESVFIVTLTTIVLTTVFVVGRLTSRFAIVRSHTWDDWFIILAWLIAFGLSFAICFGTKRGLGSRDVDIKEEWLPSLRKAQFAFTILYNPALMATKTSILIFYLRMSRNTQTLLRIASYATLGLVNVSGIVLTFLNAFQCTPPSAAYDVQKDNGRCINIITLYLCSSPVNIFCNLAILVLPIPVLTGMRLPQRQKTVLVFTFALGIFVTIVDVVRIYYLQKAVDNQSQTVERFDSTVDFSWNSSLAFLWTAVEVNVGIICACIPTLKPLIKKLMPSMITDRTRSNSLATEKTSLSSQNIPNGGSQNAEVLSPTQLLPPQAPQSPAPVHTEHDQENQMDMMDFLTTPEHGMNRTATRMTAATENTVYYGFVNMKKPKSMLKLRGKESFKYATLVTVLFFLWGFSYGLLNTLNNKISQISGQSTAQTLGLTTAYFGAYFFGALTVGQWTLRHTGFKATFIVGLCIYGTGTLMFWPSAVLRSFTGFVLSNFVVGFGLSVLETAANPFLALCGPSMYSEYRLLLAQGVQAIGSLLSQLLAQRVLFRSIVSEGEASLLDVQWTYLGIALFDVILALLFFYSPLPEATDLELEHQSEDQGIYRSQTVFHPKLPIIYITLGLAVFAQFCYVAAQEGLSIFVAPLLESQSQTPLALVPSDYVLVGHGTFAIGRFLFAALCLIIAPRILLLVSLLGCLVFSVLAMSVHSLDGNGIAAFVVMFFFFEGPVWPLIFAIGLRGLGKRTKIGAAIITAAASGGGVFPFVIWAVQVVQGRSVQFSQVVNVALFAAGCIFPLYLNLVRKARKQVRTKGSEDDLSRDDADDGANTPIRRLSRRFSVMFSKIGGGKSSMDDEPVFEHRESRTDEKGQDIGGGGFGHGMGRDTRDFASGDERSPTIANYEEDQISPTSVVFGRDGQLSPASAVLKRDNRLSAEERIWGSWERDISPTRRDRERLRGNV